MRLRWSLLTIVLLALALALSTCACPRRSSAQQRLLIRGAPSMDAAVGALAREFQRWNPDVEVVTDCVCPPCIVYQNGAPSSRYDIWVAWGEWELDRLAQASHLSFARTLAAGTTPLAIATAGTATESVHDLADLQSDAVRKIGLGDPDLVASGHHAKIHLTKAGIWPAIEDRLVFSRSGCELLKWLGLGRETDVAIVLRACASQGPVIEIPGDVCPPLPLIFARTKDAPSPQVADDFLAFLRSPEAKKILASHGIKPERAP